MATSKYGRVSFLSDYRCCRHQQKRKTSKIMGLPAGWFSGAVMVIRALLFGGNHTLVAAGRSPAVLGTGVIASRFSRMVVVLLKFSTDSMFIILRVVCKEAFGPGVLGSLMVLLNAFKEEPPVLVGSSLIGLLNALKPELRP